MVVISFCFFFSDTSTTEIYTLSLHDALPISFFALTNVHSRFKPFAIFVFLRAARSEEHTSELQSRVELVCRLLLEKKNAVTFHRARHLPVAARVRPRERAWPDDRIGRPAWQR